MTPCELVGAKAELNSLMEKFDNLLRHIIPDAEDGCEDILHYHICEILHGLRNALDNLADVESLDYAKWYMHMKTERAERDILNDHELDMAMFCLGEIDVWDS